jgi:signal transduction histidine kinase
MSERPGLAGWWRRRSLRIRLTAAATVVMSVALCGGAALLAVRLHASLITATESTARQRVDEIAGVLRTADRTGPLPPGAEADVVVQVVGAGGAVVSSSPNVEGQRRLFTFPPPGGDLAGRPAVHVAGRLPVRDSADSYRVAVEAVTIGGSPFIVYAAVPADDAADSVATLAGALAIGLPAVIAILVAITWRLVGRALRPVELLRRQAAEISATGLHRRLDVPAGGDELSRLADTLNDLLARLEASVRRQREFVADAAHELRSPLASLRAQLEVASAEPGQIADTVRMSHLVDDLLRLARLDARPGLQPRPVDLDDVVLNEARLARQNGAVAVDTAGVSGGQVLGDADALLRVVRNLLDNATRHAGRLVTVTLRTDGPHVVLTVADDGPGVPAADRERIFGRFTRLDGSRDRDQGGAGLGLAIVREVVAAHGGSVGVGDNPDGEPGARFDVRLPAAVAQELRSVEVGSERPRRRL